MNVPMDSSLSVALFFTYVAGIAVLITALVLIIMHLIDKAFFSPCIYKWHEHELSIRISALIVAKRGYMFRDTFVLKKDSVLDLIKELMTVYGCTEKQAIRILIKIFDKCFAEWEKSQND